MPIGATTQTLSPDETPTQKIVKENRPKKTVMDIAGRTIVYRTMSILDQARLYRAVGPDAARNGPYMNLMNVAAAVISIDGDIGPQPTTMSFAEMRMNWLGDDGYMAVLAEVQRQNEEDMDEAKDANERFREDVKN
jgi:hypothetical protein